MDRNKIYSNGLVVAIFLFLSNFISFIYRYKKIPDWINIFQGAILFLILLYLILLIISNNSLFKNHYSTRIMIVFSFISKGLISIVNEHYNILPDLSDVDYYNNLALNFARENVVQGSGLGASGFASYFIGNIYFLLGNSSLVISLINCFLYSITIYYLVKICFEFKILNPWPVAFIATLMPSSMLYIPVLLRESVFLLVSILFFHQLIILYKNVEGRLKNHLISLLFLVLSTFIRPQIFPIYFLIYILFMIYFHKGLIRIFSTLFIFIFLFFISISSFKLFQFIDSNLLNLYYFQLYRNAFSDLPNAYLVNIVYKDWFDFFSYLPRFLMHYMFAPYPWVSSNYKFFMATLDSIVSLTIMITSLLIIINNFKIFKKYLLKGTLCFLVLTMPFAIIEAYPMGAVRHRMIVLMLMLPLFTLILPSNIVKFRKNFN
jgi:hypothetical protein